MADEKLCVSMKKMCWSLLAAIGEWLIWIMTFFYSRNWADFIIADNPFILFRGNINLSQYYSSFIYPNSEASIVLFHSIAHILICCHAFSLHSPFSEKEQLGVIVLKWFSKTIKLQVLILPWIKVTYLVI